MLYGCILIPGAPAPQISPELMERISKPELGGKKKSAVINIAIDQGGNFPESHSTYYDNPVYFDSLGNMMFGVANMPDFVGGIASVDLERTNVADTAALALGFAKAMELSPRLKSGVNIYDKHLFIEDLRDTYSDMPMASFAYQTPVVMPRSEKSAGESFVDLNIQSDSESRRDKVSGSLLDDLGSAITLGYSDIQEISEGIIAQMAAGLAGEPSSLDMTPTFVTAPTGKEKGDYFAIDVGGSNLRVLGVRLDGNGGYTEIGKQKLVEFQARQKTGTKEELFDFIANAVWSYFMENDIDMSGEIRMGLSWSFPVELTGIASARHKEWTKGWNVSGVVGEDVVGLMHAAFKRAAIGNAKVVALCNDTTGTLAAARYAGYSDCVGGMVLGTGWNAAFELLTSHIGKLAGFDGDRMMVNTEWENYALPLLTKWDQELDLRPGVHGKQMLEKHVSGKYLGEIARLIIKDLVSQGRLFNGRAPEIFASIVVDIGKDGFLTEHMSAIEFDRTPDMTGVKKVLDMLGALDSSIEDRRIIKS
ncbi:MAG TPA: hypothetical protein PLV52_06165, partial [Candidatus Omnitrophota bacterium]|nr:hypothetical protein [Candidatus Omnitrophota bacterium]